MKINGLRAIKACFRKSDRVFRRLTANKRSLPNFIIIGAQKSGTSSLFWYLSQHPQIRSSFVKEVHFFDGGLDPAINNFSKGVGWYRAHFPIENRKFITGEASPLYIFNPLVPERIHNVLPGVKLIAVLRNPVERAISHYFHEKRKGREEKPILEALELEEERLRPILEQYDYKSEIFKNKSYKSRGLYKKQLERFLDYFSWDQILILSSEDLFTNSKDTLEKTFHFLKVDPSVNILNLDPKNVGSNRTKVEQRVYDYLVGHFASPNQELYDFIGHDLGW